MGSDYAGCPRVRDQLAELRGRHRRDRLRLAVARLADRPRGGPLRHALAVAAVTAALVGAVLVGLAINPAGVLW